MEFTYFLKALPDLLITMLKYIILLEMTNKKHDVTDFGTDLDVLQSRLWHIEKKFLSSIDEITQNLLLVARSNLEKRGILRQVDRAAKDPLWCYKMSNGNFF